MIKSRMVGIPHRSGTREYLTCEPGEIEMHIGREKFVLAAGEAIVFRGDYC